MDQNYQYNPNGEDDNYDRRPTRFSNLNQNYPYSERQQPPRLPFHFSGNEGYNQPMYNIPPPPPPQMTIMTPEPMYQVQYPPPMNPNFFLSDMLSTGELISVFNKVCEDDEKIHKQFRPYTALPNQIQTKDKPRYKSGQFVDEKIQEKVIDCIMQIRKTEDETRLNVDYRMKDKKDFNQGSQKNRGYSSSSSSSYSRSSSSSSSSSSSPAFRRNKSFGDSGNSSKAKANKFAQIDDEWHKRKQEFKKKNNEQNQTKEANSHMKEMGLLNDGRAIGSIGNMISDKSGIGSLNKDDVLDVTQFRMNMSMKFQQASEDRAKGISDSLRCYICQNIGHQAKDCKYGLT